MDKQYNLYNLEALFKQYLTAENISPISSKNYLSDLRHFFGWLTFKLRVTSYELKVTSDSDVVSFIDSLFIDEYKSYLVENNLPLKTVNRRLSTLRKFCSFCILQGWMKTNPAKQIKNQKSKVQNINLTLKTEEIIDQFNLSLHNTKESAIQIEERKKDIREFLSFSEFTFNI